MAFRSEHPKDVCTFGPVCNTNCYGTQIWNCTIYIMVSGDRASYSVCQSARSAGALRAVEPKVEGEKPSFREWGRLASNLVKPRYVLFIIESRLFWIIVDHVFRVALPGSVLLLWSSIGALQCVHNCFSVSLSLCLLDSLPNNIVYRSSVMDIFWIRPGKWLGVFTHSLPDPWTAVSVPRQTQWLVLDGSASPACSYQGPLSAGL